MRAQMEIDSTRWWQYNALCPLMGSEAIKTEDTHGISPYSRSF